MCQSLYGCLSNREIVKKGRGNFINKKWQNDNKDIDISELTKLLKQV